MVGVPYLLDLSQLERLRRMRTDREAEDSTSNLCEARALHDSRRVLQGCCREGQFVNRRGSGSDIQISPSASAREDGQKARRAR